MTLMLRGVVLVVLLAGLGGSVAAATGPEAEPWAKFSKWPARGENATVSIGTSDFQRDKPVIYWARIAGTSVNGSTDSVQCPALRSVVESLDDVSVPRLSEPEVHLIIGDGTAYALTVSWSNLDQVSISARGGAVADWIDGALTRLKDCWSS